MKYFAIRPVRGITQEYADAIELQLETIRKEGHEIYDPIKDTNQLDSIGLRICNDNRRAIEDCDAVLFLWDGKSTGCLFDLGMAFALRKSVRTVVGYMPRMTNGKSFQNMVFAWEEFENKL